MQPAQRLWDLGSILSVSVEGIGSGTQGVDTHRCRPRKSVKRRIMDDHKSIDFVPRFLRLLALDKHAFLKADELVEFLHVAEFDEVFLDYRRKEPAILLRSEYSASGRSTIEENDVDHLPEIILSQRGMSMRENHSEVPEGGHLGKFEWLLALWLVLATD